MALSESLRQHIQDTIDSNPVLVFMKGDRSRPQCGFSGRVVNILDQLVPQYTTINILENPDLREGIKEFSSWPTIPQIYIKGEFIGGCDILIELAQSGELHTLLGVEKPAPVGKIDLHVTPTAMRAFKDALEDVEDDEFIRLSVSPTFAHELSIGPKAMNDVQVNVDGLPVLVDGMSAQRANGVRIDFAADNASAGFQITNPNQPASVKQLTAQEVKAKQDKHEPFVFFDVRTRDEWNTARIPGTRLLLDVPAEEIEAMDKSTPIVFHCKSGGRSQKAAEQFHTKGFKNVANLKGGIHAWTKDVDPSLPPC